jgi:hypothetical protein
MAISSIEILGTIPLGTYIIVQHAKDGVTTWTSWADIHRHYSVVVQVAGVIWKNDRIVSIEIEMFRWSLVACAFIFFAFFGFADEARQHYRRVYSSLASGIGYLMFTLRGSSRGCVVHSLCWSVQTHWVFCSTLSAPPHMKSKGGITVHVATTGGNKHRSSVSLTNQISIPSISIGTENEPDFEIEQNSPLNTVLSFSVENIDGPMLQGQSTAILPAGISQRFLLHLFRLISLTRPIRPCPHTPALTPSKEPELDSLHLTFISSLLWIFISIKKLTKHLFIHL